MKMFGWQNGSQHLPFKYPCGVLDCLVCTKTVSVTTFPTTMANARLTMNTTAKVRLTNPQQQRVQRGASDWPEPSPAWAAAVRLKGPSVVATRTAVLPGTLMLGSRAVMAQDRLIYPCDVSVVGLLRRPCPGMRNCPVEKYQWTPLNRWCKLEKYSKQCAWFRGILVPFYLFSWIPSKFFHRRLHHTPFCCSRLHLHCLGCSPPQLWQTHQSWLTECRHRHKV